MKRTSPVVHPPPKPAKVPHYDTTGQNIVSGNNINERPPHFLPSQFGQSSQQPLPNTMQNFAPATSSSSLEPPLMSPEISSGPASTDRNSKNDEGKLYITY